MNLLFAFETVSPVIFKFLPEMEMSLRISTMLFVNRDVRCLQIPNPSIAKMSAETKLKAGIGASE